MIEATVPRLIQIDVDPVQLWVSVLASRHAYRNKCELPAEYNFSAGQKFHSKWSSATAYLLQGPKYDVLVFRGSQEFLDWIINAAAVLPPSYYGGAFCHTGFAYAHWTLWRKIRRHIDQTKPLLITGHSLGGALADITANFLLNTHWDHLHLITHGKPNVYIKPTAPSRPSLSTELSVVSGSDLVTRIPRALYGPSVTQNMLYFANDGIDYINPLKPFRLRDYDLSEAVSDHSITLEYESRVRLLVTKPSTGGQPNVTGI